MTQDDREQLRRWHEGDGQAGQQLVRRHYDGLFLFFHARLDAEVSADLTQSVFETLFARAKEFRGDSSLRTFLFGIARWKLIEHVRRLGGQREYPHAFDSGLTMAASSDSLSSMLDARRRESMVVQALRSLSLDDQIVLELKDYEGLTAREMAEIFDVPAGTIATRIRKARARLTDAVRQRAASEEEATATLTDLNEHMRCIRAQMHQLGLP